MKLVSASQTNAMNWRAASIGSGARPRHIINPNFFFHKILLNIRKKSGASVLLFFSLRTGHMHSFRFAKLWLVLGWMLVSLVVILSLWPKPPELLGFEQSDKLSHIMAYMILMLWFANIYPQRPHQVRLAIWFFAMGAGLELLQGLTGYRTFKFADILANGFGIFLALYLAKTRLATCILHLDTWLVRPN
jgi:hypothetical protein